MLESFDSEKLASTTMKSFPLVQKIVTKMKSKHPNKDMDPNDEMEIVMEVINEEIEKAMYRNAI
jgi:hypothetical protein